MWFMYVKVCLYAYIDIDIVVAIDIGVDMHYSW